MNKDMPDNIWASFDPPAAIEAYDSEYDGATEYLRRTVSREDARAALEWWEFSTTLHLSPKYAETIRKLLEQAGK